MNYSFCSRCRKQVEAEHIQKEGKEYLRKVCPDCGESFDLVSGDAELYNRKRALLADEIPEGCDLNCLQCNGHRDPNLIFVETTNRCNMNCPICITNVPSMGFEFEPDMEYFRRIFEYCASFEFPPSVQLFGGEPTVREDLFEIIELAKSYGLSVRLVTNGLKLADPDYCDRIMRSGVSVLISFDGLKREMYEKLRGSASSMDLKLKALDNISSHKRGKVILMTVIDKDMNADDMDKFLEYCFDNSRVVRGVFPMPLTQVWSEDTLDYKPERTTVEDVEKTLDRSVDGKVEFVPLGSLTFDNLARLFGLRPLPFAGVHPNCESFALLVNNGSKFVAMSNYLRTDVFSLVKDIRDLEKKADAALKRGGKNAWTRIRIGAAFARIALKHADLGGIVGARGLGAVRKWAGVITALIAGKRAKDVFKEKTMFRGILQILVLPFEHDETQESQRLQHCSSGYTYIDESTDRIRWMPTCIWDKFKDDCLRSNARRFNKKGYDKGIANPRTAARERSVG
ncbi:MAG: radical SAM protein [Candidatus Omnitrophica bacterium]|nr:radical SAM protein [Candidatus Omnitrophota bacterium]